MRQDWILPRANWETVLKIKICWRAQPDFLKLKRIKKRLMKLTKQMLKRPKMM